MLIRIVIFLLFVSFVPLTAQEIDIKYADSLLTSISELDKKSQRGALDTFRKRLAMVSREAADPIFQAFLQSGMARTVVPVRPGFEDAVNWYMTTGEIWNGQGLVVDQDDDLYVSVAEEMMTIEGGVEDTWETRLPTALTILQADSIGLDVQGLPCNPECIPEGNNPIVPSTDLIGGIEGPSGVGSDSVGEVITVQ